MNYVIFGSYAARLQGAELRTVDVDLVPQPWSDNLQRLAAALNSLRPRWRTEETGRGMKIDGQLEERHFLGEDLAIGFVTTVGYIDVILSPRGFEAGYDAVLPGSVVVTVEGNAVRVGGLADLIHSKTLLGRAKDLNHLVTLRQRLSDMEGAGEDDAGPVP